MNFILYRRRLQNFFCFCVAFFALFGFIRPASAQEDSSPSSSALVPCADLASSGDSEVHVTKVFGLLDVVAAEHILSELDVAEDVGAVGFVLRVDSKGSVLSSEQLEEIAVRLRDSSVETGIWVGSGSSTIQGGTAQLAKAVDRLAVAPGSDFGNLGTPLLDASFADLPQESLLRESLVTAPEAEQMGLSVRSHEDMADVKQFLAGFAGSETVACETESGQSVRFLQTDTQLSGMSMVSQLFHTVSSPEVAYLSFVLGLSLLIFEFFTAGVGIAGVLGAGSFLMGSYGLANLPVRWWAVGLICVAFTFFSIDIQTNLPRFYSGVGVALLILGSLFLYEQFRQSWVTFGFVVAGVVLYVYAGMPSMVRSRFSTPTIGRAWMIGELGQAVTDISPEGQVKIHGVPWKAITNRATPVQSGDQIRVVGLDRLVLEIEPESGGAKDYRERKPKE